MTFHHITATSHSVLMKRVPQKATISRLNRTAWLTYGANLWFYRRKVWSL